MVDPQFVDAEQWLGANMDKLSFRLIALEHLRKILTLATKEWRGGYWEDRKVSIGGQISFVKTYVPDSRQEYINAVDSLADLLFPHFDEEIRKAEVDVNKTVKAIKTEDQQDYLDQVIRHKRVLFRALSSFLKRQQYLQTSSFEGAT